MSAAEGRDRMPGERHVASDDAATLRARLRHVYWIGGGSGGGKSTVARRIAARYGLRLYVTDDVMSDHANRSDPNLAPALSEFVAMDMDERWVNRSPQTMLETFHWFRGECFAEVIDELVHLPPAPGVIAEGFRLLPHLVRPLLDSPDHAVWLLPTPAFRRAAFSSRGTSWQIAGKTNDPARALQNLLERDRMFTERLRDEATSLDLQLIEVDTTMTEEELTDRVTEALGL
ncbi:nucleoside/nucleotide kinase family protein [Pengzhenrongella sicca]|uniref:Cytidylate kinase n=1 Tax=Pengzhenrongella sicca TaxID=2819238 RepID=A0A8A4ZC05_9MICO|nr:hypothetical protein [Pengzhenrongella sicca]QTE28539.1 hypothetical protein J4E96_14345 [Pengzhenrongella sicca]